jgi:hypothetical protein
MLTLLRLCTLAAFALPALMPSQSRAADSLPPPPVARAVPPAYVAPPAPPPPYGYAPPPVYGYAPPVYVRPPGVIAVPEGPAYAVPGPVYQPGDEYIQAPVLVDSRRYYRDCWFEWGFRRCVLKPRW